MNCSLDEAGVSGKKKHKREAWLEVLAQNVSHQREGEGVVGAAAPGTGGQGHPF